MSTLREELHAILDSVPEEELAEVKEFLEELLGEGEPEELTDEEWQHVREGEAEIARGEWVRWRDVKRTDGRG